MTEAQNAETPATTEAEPTLDQRIAQAMGGIEPSEPAPVEEDSPPAAPTGADSGDPAAARRARLEELKAQNTAEAEQRQRETAQRQQKQEFEDYKRRAEEAEARMAGLVDLNGIDPDRFFELCAEHGITPDTLADHVRKSREDPSVVAREAAKKVASTEAEALRKLLAEQQARLDAIDERDQRSRAQHDEYQAATELFTTVKASTDAPRAAAFLKEKGEERFYKFALRTAANLPEGGGMQAVIDSVEEALEDLASIYTSTQPPAPKRSASAPADTISNRLASERSEVHEPSDWADLTLEERAARISKS